MIFLDVKCKIMIKSILKKEGCSNDRNSKLINAHFIKIDMVLTTLKCDVENDLGTCYQVDLKTRQGQDIFWYLVS